MSWPTIHEFYCLMKQNGNNGNKVLTYIAKLISALKKVRSVRSGFRGSSGVSLEPPFGPKFRG